MKYPIGIQSFDKIINEGYLYIDKTELIYDLVHNGNIYFLSRPRRFGKSLLVSTLECYFQGRKELFKGLAMEKLETEWKEYPVFHIDFNGKDFTKENELESVLTEFVETQEAIYGKSPFATTLGSRFREILKAAHEKTGLRAVVLIDEYDKPLLDVMDLEMYVTTNESKITLEDYNRNTLKGFYSVFKEADEHLQFVLLTGVTKFSQVSVFSGFNQPDDISLSARYDTLLGITEEELHTVFKEQIKEMAREYEFTEDEMKVKLKRQFDGYHFSRRLIGVYNPFSILRAFNEMWIDDYWFKTGSPTYLVRLLAHDNEHINELVGKYYTTQDFDDYKADVERPLPMIYQSGYLTIKGYDERFKKYRLGFPNKEVEEGFLNFLLPFYSTAGSKSPYFIEEFVKDVESGNPERFMKRLSTMLADTDYKVIGNAELYFHNVMYLIFKIMGFYTQVERPTSDGRIDAIFRSLRNGQAPYI